MRVRMRGRKVHRLDALRAVPPRALESQDPADAWAAVGVLVSKSPRRQAANGGSFSVWTLSDLSRRENEVSLFLFQEALGSHWTVCEGTLIAVVGAKVLPDKGGGGGNAPQRLAFSVDSPWQVNRIGMSMDYGLCKGKRKDGKPCTMPVNKTEGGGFCEFHVVAAFNRAQRKEPVGNKTKGNTQQPALSMSAKLGASGLSSKSAAAAVFLQMPQRCPVRQDGTRSAEGEKMLADAQVLMKQRAIKEKADQRGLLLRPQDPNSASSIGKKSSDKPSGLRAGSNKRQAARPGANPLLAAGGRGGDGGDPLAKKVKTMSAVEKELLLRRVSKYAGLAEEERAKDADRSVQRLEQREAMADKAEEVTKMVVTVFACTQCKTRRSRFNKRCRDLGHDQKGVKATLRFFECTNCRKRCSSTERVPRTGCESCGRHDMWKRCGARPGRGPAEGPRDKRFVAALSESGGERLERR
ncbi:conserved unknown protein [Ectocarpus siliculosus]|uniref:Protein MCM10 homolog n=1 Tax=Ectocarpus siliculosus TaxID=2880 RepID=D8LM23_ECTSI|nr:conserved unknown protein [Ectocarpus siliculosus]|eukprot:CBN77237.1 conserved unknown protein [Ectocarpus siliculosus]